jgi:DNA modification methylase
VVVPKSTSAFCAKCGAWRGELGAEPTPELYVAHLVEVFREVRRVLHPSGTLWLNLGDSYCGSGRGRLSDGSHASCGDMQATNVGTTEGAMFPPPVPPGLKPKDLCGIPWQVAFALRADGWYLRSEIIWAKNNPMPESVTDRPTRAHEQVFLLAKEARYFFDQEAVREPHQPGSQERAAYGFKGSAERNEQMAEAHHGKGFMRNGGEPTQFNSAGRNIRSVWTINTHSFPGAHFATFPPALAERCIRAGTSERGCCPGCGAPWARVVERVEAEVTNPRRFSKAGNDDRQDTLRLYKERVSQQNGWAQTCPCPPHDPVPCTVLDCFGGSGTTGMVADRLGRDAILIDLNPDYTGMAEARVTKDAGLFAEVATESTPQRTQPAVSALPGLEE